MAQRTRLFQNAGSPLIQGYSRSRQPFWREWLLTIAVTIGAMVVWRAAVAISGPALSPDAMWDSVRSAVLVGGAVGVVVGALGVAVARGMGARRPWVAAAIASAFVATIVWAVWPTLR